MKKFKDAAKKFVTKHGHVLAAFALVMVTVAANSSCVCPFYEPEEPNGLNKFKKFN